MRDEQQLSWTRRVRWCRGDVLSREDQQWKALLGPSAADGALPAVDAVVSCVGGFGSVSHMRRVNGDANIAVFEAASRSPHIRRLGFVSAFHYQLPAILQRGYLEGKLAAEASLHTLFPSSPSATATASPTVAAPRSAAAVVSQTGVLYGVRYLRSLGLHLPLQLLFAPLGLLTDTSLVRAIRQLPLLGPLLTPALLPPVSVDDLSDAMIETLMDDSLAAGVHTLTVEEIRQAQHAKRQ